MRRQSGNEENNWKRMVVMTQYGISGKGVDCHHAKNIRRIQMAATDVKFAQDSFGEGKISKRTKRG